MKQYKVIAGAMPCMEQNKVFEGGDIIPADFFLEGQAEQKVKDGFLELMPEDVADATPATPAKKAATKK